MRSLRAFALLSIVGATTACDDQTSHVMATARDAGRDTGADVGEPDAPRATVTGTVSGLEGSGLVLQIDGGNDTPIARNGKFSFAADMLVGETFALRIAQQPSSPSQTCTLSADAVTVRADGAEVSVTCTTNTYTIGGTVTGLSGSGLRLVNNDGDVVDVAADGAFTFPAPIASGATYTVMVAAQPSEPTQTCTVSGGSGTVAAGDVTSVAVDCSVDAFSIGGTVDGLAGAGLVLQNNAGDSLAVNANGSFAFAAPVASGASFAVSVKSQPTSPWQTCSVSQGDGSVAAADVSSVVVHCVTSRYTVGGAVSGLLGSGLVLQNVGADDLPIAADGAFTFVSSVASGVTYAVGVLSQPTMPSQTCVVTNAGGTLANSAVGNVSVACTTNSYAVGGNVTGLSGAGLSLRLNGGDALPIAADGSFAFPAAIASGEAFTVSIEGQPSSPSQTCVLSGETGTVVAGPVSSVLVNCNTDQFAVGGSVADLVGSGLVLSLNGTPSAINANGVFAFPDALASGAAYHVTVSTQPSSPSQTCALTGADGTVGDGPVEDVGVLCTTNSFNVGGDLMGLVGSGLVLQNNLGDDITPTANGMFMFDTPVTSGQSYAISVKTQPSAPAQTCDVMDGAGVVGGEDVMDPMVHCTTNTYRVGGTVSGLAGTLVIRNNGLDARTITANGAFEMPTSVASGDAYSVTVSAQPSSPSQSCVVTNGSGSVSNADVTSVAIVCVTNTFSVGGSASGLLGSGLVLRNNGGNDLPVSGDGSFTFSTPVASGQPYSVSVATQPSNPSQTCTVSGGAGNVGGSNVTSVTVNCTTDAFTVGGTVTGLLGTGLVLQNALADDLPVSGAGSYAFATPVPSGGSYDVSVLSQPTSPWQTCGVGVNHSGSVTSANITNADVSCTTNSYAVAVNVSGLSGSGLVLQNNGGNNLAVGANGVHTFSTSVASGQAYNVTVLTAPSTPTQTCVVTNGSGVVGGAAVTLNVNCTTDSFMVMGDISGLYAGTVVLQNNGGDDLTVSANGHIMFDTSVLSGATYNVTVLTQPAANLYLSCSVSNGSGTITNQNIVNVAVTCRNRVLFIDDDAGRAGETTWLQALTAAGYAYDVETITANANPTSDFSLYRIVIWSIGDHSYSNLTADNITKLTAYLNLGGRSLLYGGGHSLYDEPVSPTFISNYLGVGSYNTNMPTKSGSADGTATGLNALAGQTYNWNIWPGGEYTNMLSAFAPLAGSTSLLQVNNVNATGVTNGARDIITLKSTTTFKAMTWGIDLNHVSAGQRVQLLSNCLAQF